MPSWVVIPLILLAVWTIIGIVFAGNRGWLHGGLFTVDDLKGIYFIGVVTCWLISTLLYGIVFVSVHNDTRVFLWPFSVLVVIPVGALIVIALILWFSNQRYHLIKSDEEFQIQLAIQQCEHWLGRFDFLTPERYSIQLYFINGRPSGRLSIHGVRASEVDELRIHEKELPTGIFLSVLSDD